VAVLDAVKHIGRERCASFRRHILQILAVVKLSNHFKSRDGIHPLMPRRAPEGLNGFARRGDAGRHRVFRKGWDALSKNPVQSLRRAGLTRHGVSFLLGTFLWTSKEKYHGCRSANRHQNSPSR
jgi:hypothetical protein